jgi:ABC-type bacteriocin/lantibiotic exporter with double-glycine peptidase domain
VCPRLSAMLLLFSTVSAGTAADDIDCGLRCLYVATVALGHDSDYAKIKSLAPPSASSKGYSLAQLRDLAADMGLQTALIRTDHERLARRSQRQPFACIAWLNNDHFVLITDVRADRLLVVDPPHRRWTDNIVFSHRWDGSALLLANEPLIPEESLVHGHRLSRLGIGLCGFLLLGICLFTWRHRRCASPSP